MRFVHESLNQRVYFVPGEAARALGDEVERLGSARIMVIATPSRAETAEALCTDIPVVHRHHGVAMHVPLAVAQKARTAARDHDADLLVSVGGGSTIGVAKAVALTTRLPIVAVPTTYAGSEATSIWGLTEGGRKTTGVDAQVLPRAIVYDAALTMSLPVPVSVASGLNALAHSVDAMWGPRADPIDRVLAAEAARTVTAGLSKVVTDPTGLEGREQVLYGTYLSAVAFSSAGAGLHHKICHVLGGRYDLPHAQTHAVVLPYVVAFNAAAAPDAEARLAAAFNASTALGGLQLLRQSVDAPKALREYGFREKDIGPAAAAIVEEVPQGNPRPVSKKNLKRLLYAAWHGADPRTITTDEETE